MITVYKYEINSSKSNILVHMNCKILNVGLDPKGVQCIWALVNTDEPIIAINVITVGTGWEIEEDIGMLEHIGTYKQNMYIWHTFIKK